MWILTSVVNKWTTMSEEETQKNKTFFNGSWHTYRLKDLVDPDKISMARIKRSENAFRENYFATVELLCPSPIFLSWRLTIKQKPKKKRRSPRKAEETVVEKTSIFRLALYKGTGKENEKALLFCNRVIPNKIKDLLIVGLSCSDIERYLLSGSSPPELLKLHLDAKRETLQLEGVYVETFSDFTVLGSYGESMEEENSAVIKKIGRIEDERLPKIKYVSVEFSKVPLDYYRKSKIAKLKNWSFSSVDMEMKSSSVLHLYGALSEYLYEKDVPDWLSDGIRKRGKTMCKVHYE